MYSYLNRPLRRLASSKERQMARNATGRTGKAKGDTVPRNGARKSAYKVYTRPELYEDERPLVTWLVRIAIVISMLGIGAVFRQPLHEVVASVFGRLSG
jgi:hypothetical protein